MIAEAETETGHIIKVFFNEEKLAHFEGWHITNLPKEQLTVFELLSQEVCFQKKNSDIVPVEFYDLVRCRVTDIPADIISQSHGMYQVEYVAGIVKQHLDQYGSIPKEGIVLAVWRWRRK
ncbi:MAG: hypothetical protein ACKVPJ_13570 [Chitinophagales bacterium]